MDGNDTWRRHLQLEADSQQTIEEQTNGSPDAHTEGTAEDAINGLRTGSRTKRAAKQTKGLPRMLQEAQITLDAKLQEHSVALAEHNRLKQRIKVISQVLPLLEQQVEYLKAKNSVLRPPLATICTITEGSGGSGSPSSSSSAGTLLDRPGTPSSESVDASNLRTLLAEPYFEIRSGRSIKHMPERQVVSEAATVTALSTSQASNSRVNEQVQAASSLLKETIHKLAVNFMAQSVHPNDPAHLQAVEYNLAVFRRQLRQLVTEDTNFWITLLNRNLETGESGPPPERHWAEMARSLAITPQQVEDCAAVLDLFESQMAGVAEERSTLLAQLSQSLNGLDFTQELTSQSSVHEEHVTAEMGLHALERNLAKERSARHVLSTYLGSPQVLTLQQIAKAYVGAWPYMVDVVALCAAVVANAKAAGTRP